MDVRYGGAASDAAYSQGSSLDEHGVFSVVTSALAAGALPVSEQAIYGVLGDASVSNTNDGAGGAFCSEFCGWHSAGGYQHADGNIYGIKFMYIGDAGRQCPGACSASALGPRGVSPNGDASLDAMLSVTAHEIAEAITDPYLNAWGDADGEENADKCAW